MLTIAPGIELDVQRGPDWLLVRIETLEVDQPEPISLADEVWSLMERHLTHRLVLDMTNVPVLNRHLISELLRLHQRAAEQNGVLRVCGLSARNHRVWRVCGLDDRLLPYDTWQEAVMGCNRPRRAK
jgi:anti-anti-sigma regulatory factor